MAQCKRLGRIWYCGQFMHRLSDDAFAIHHFLLGVGKKQGGGKDKSDVIRFFWTEDKH